MQRRPGLSEEVLIEVNARAAPRRRVDEFPESDGEVYTLDDNGTIYVTPANVEQATSSTLGSLLATDNNVACVDENGSAPQPTQQENPADAPPPIEVNEAHEIPRRAHIKTDAVGGKKEVEPADVEADDAEAVLNNFYGIYTLARSSLFQ
eukprot:TRINITY_DN15344_c0_g1_i13.p1 TRINITY_DN15344_c0_g1~~TRINITY_DN15344_c0_g1_i13.p1  ORF type:complete len:150 (+),score=42.29 TRINITY_DN15344_c0_g1_i13:39-488(+)